MERIPTLEQIKYTIRAARDSVWVINTELENLAGGEVPVNSMKGNIERNVEHLKIITTSPHILSSGEDISDLLQAIIDGEAKLAEVVWPPEQKLNTWQY